MPESRWFVPDPADVPGFTPAELRFATTLSAATEHLAGAETAYDLLWSAANADFTPPALVAGLGFIERRNPGPSRNLLTFGVELNSDRVRGGKLDSQLYQLVDYGPPSLAFEATGDIESLAEQTAAWFESVLRRPVVRFGWLHNGQQYASSYEFADTHERIVYGYDRSKEPPGEYDRLVAAGHVSGKGWPQLDGLPAQHQYTLLRGDRALADIPRGVKPAD
ncbi:MAG TPA: hypothetical protein VGN81_08255 [Pseudonocardiaceae bacterium]|jgi:hypothetical protein